MHWDSLVDYMNSTLQTTFTYEDTNMGTFFSFVNDAGVKYNPVRTITGPYGSTSIFTGPKVWL